MTTRGEQILRAFVAHGVRLALIWLTILQEPDGTRAR